MRTQSIDTSPAFERVHIAHIRTFSAAKKFASTRSWTQSIISANLHYSSSPSDTQWERDQAISFVAREYGEPLASLFLQALQRHSEWRLQAPDIQEAILSFFDIAEQIDVPAVIIGSVASSLYGFPRSVHDVDIMAPFSTNHLAFLLQQLAQYYVFDPHAVTLAMQQQTSFSMLHLSSLIKVDIFLPSTIFDSLLLHRKQPQMLVDGRASLPVASVEDVILLSLRQYETEGSSADDRWNDILGMLKIQAPHVDCAYLVKQAKAMGLTDVLSQALTDAGLRDEAPSVSQ